MSAKPIEPDRSSRDCRTCANLFGNQAPIAARVRGAGLIATSRASLARQDPALGSRHRSHESVRTMFGRGCGPKRCIVSSISRQAPATAAFHQFGAGASAGSTSTMMKARAAPIGRPTIAGKWPIMIDPSGLFSQSIEAMVNDP